MSFTRKLCLEKLDESSLEAFVACRLFSLDKNPGLRPIGVGEILRCITGKIVVSSTRNDVIDTVGLLQVFAGHETGCEAVIHARNNVFQDEQKDPVLLVDAANAFNAVSRRVLLQHQHNLPFDHNICSQLLL